MKAYKGSPIVSLPLHLLREDNYRQHYDEGALKELAASIKEHGVLQPIRVRPDADGKGYRVVCGMRRVLASRLAERKDIPGCVVKLTDEEARVEQLVENSQRADPHPMDEATAFRELMETHGLSQAEVTARTGKNAGYVFRRLKLCNLVPAAREALLANKLLLGVAELLATVPDEESQTSALNDFLAEREPVSVAWARDHLEDCYQRHLAHAPFPTGDGKLLAGTPACSACPKSTACQGALFGAVTQKDARCTDKRCWDEKKEANWTRTLERALSQGHEVLDDERCQALFPYSSGALSHQAPYVDLEVTAWADPKHRMWGELLAGIDVPVTIARERSGRVHLLVSKEDVAQVLRLTAPRSAVATAMAEEKKREETAAAAPAYDAKEAEKQRRAAGERRTLIVQRALASMVERVSSSGPVDETFWRVLCASFFQGGYVDAMRDVAKRRGVEVPEGGQVFEALQKYAEALAWPDVPALVLELAVVRNSCPGHTPGALGEFFRESVTALGVKLEPLEAEVDALLAERAAAKATRRKGKAKAGAPADDAADAEDLEGEEEAQAAAG